jgi:hypothetical protein
VLPELGASSIALARAYPPAPVLGVDLDQASVTEARAQAAQAGVADRVTFQVGDAAQLTGEGPSELVTIFEALHDMGPGGSAAGGQGPAGRRRQRPGRRRARGRRLHRPGRPSGAVHVRLEHPALPARHPRRGPRGGQRTVLRAPTVARWAAAAGFTGFEALPIDNPFWRFYHLHG